MCEPYSMASWASDYLRAGAGLRAALYIGGLVYIRSRDERPYIGPAAQVPMGGCGAAVSKGGLALGKPRPNRA